MPLTRVYSLPALPARPDDGHKGTFRRVFVIGGGHEILGAPLLAGTAALRTGAGMVQIALHPSMLAAAMSVTPELLGHALDADSDTLLLEHAAKADVLVIGPGMGTDPAARRRLRLLLTLAKPTIIDADATTLLSTEPAPYRHAAPMILTPHPVEMSRLGKLFGDTSIPTTDTARIALAARAAAAFNAVVVLKGARTVVTDAARVYVSTVANSSLGKAGSGDVLAGICGTLLAQMSDPFDAAHLAVALHARAGAMAGERLSRRSVLARDIIDALPPILRESDPR